VDKHGELIDFMLLDRRDTGAAATLLEEIGITLVVSG